MAEKIPTRRNVLEQGRAQHAFDSAKKAKDLEKFASYAKKFPMMIKSNGLGAALAFAFSKSDWKELYNAVEKWIIDDTKGLVTIGPGRGELLREVVKLDSRSYRALTAEVIAYLSWLRRFAEGFKQEKK